ncbi:Reverse gyrase (plasmid) [Rhodococcus ruber]|uniref:DEAD/DEAH box helicase family protein n=1 Tax=Rhodococcus ruber TaxID=1830 RepID=UPI00315D4D05
MAFAKTGRKLAVPEDPEALYRQLARTNTGPDNLWGHQTEILRDWHSDYQDKPDVALELPTGAGKTLVGGLIAEWLRQSKREPVAYLCPNRQLAVQAAGRLQEYGIPTSLLLGKVNMWDPVQRARFTSADAVAVSVYSHVFNTNPGIVGAGTLLFDDAHAGEQPVASAWSVTVKRQEQAYQSVLSALADTLDPLIVGSLREDNSLRKDGKDVFLCDPTRVAQRAGNLEQVLGEAVTAGHLDKKQKYPLELLAGKIGRCMIYVSHRQILIRPLISPTTSHPAFSNPTRRVYMSATLGAGGELERAFGRPTIVRMPVPRGWDKEGTGRRFYVFPELTKEISSDDAKLEPWLKSTIEGHGRAVLLCPSSNASKKILDKCLPNDYVALDGHNVEADMRRFTSTSKAVLNLANRYDGVDLPDDACRLLILAGLPAQGDLQERFLYDEVGAGSVLQERIRARIVQGSGRATRNAKDHATVVVVGDDLTNFVIRGDVLGSLRQELQAEIDFGRAQSLDRPISDVDENIGLFRAQSSDWFEVEADITADRDSRERKDPPATAEFAAAAPAEVAAIDAWWNGDPESALEHLQNVLGALSQNPSAQHYAALWQYLAACWTQTLGGPSGGSGRTFGKASAGYVSRARESARGTTWLSHLIGATAGVVCAEDFDELDRLAARTILERLASGSRHSSKAFADAQANLAQTQWKKYEAGLEELGKFAGATETFGSGGAQAAPDSVWVFGEILWVAWEAKSEASGDSSVAVRHAREATGHLRYIASKRQTEPPVGSFTCYATPQTKVDHAARAVCGDDVYLVPLHAAADLLTALGRAWERVRALGPACDEAGVLAALRAEDCLPTQWVPRFSDQRLNSVGLSITEG